MSFNTALSGLKAISSDLRVTSNNIANVSTVGFKKARAEFADVYAASASGTSSIAIGSGVRLATVRQNFSQGTVSFTDNNLDMAINGQGFFITEDASGSLAYTRAGQFGTDKDGLIVNSRGEKLQGFQADSSGSITGGIGNIAISSANLSPNASSTIGMTLNLDADETAPTSTWLGAPNYGSDAPATNTYNNSTSLTVYDSLGNSHLLTAYFIKDSSATNSWDARFRIDGQDVSTSSSKSHNILSSEQQLTQTGSYPSLSAVSANDISIIVGGTTTNIGAPVTDGVSTQQATASAAAVANAINTASITGLTVTVVPNTLNLGTFTTGTLSGNDLRINNQQITVTSPGSQAQLISAINASSAGVTASTSVTSSGVEEIILTANDSGGFTAGRNIEIYADGTSTAATFANFSLSTTNNYLVKRGAVNLNHSSVVEIAGNQPSNAGITATTYYPPWNLIFNSDGTFDASQSDTIVLNDWIPKDTNGVANGSTNPQTLTVALSNLTQFGSPFAVQALSQDGYTTGRLNDLDVDSEGILFGRYSNGQSRTIAQIALANFTSTDGLQALGDTSWGETSSSGAAVVSKPGTGSLGVIQSGALEDSNVELTDEFVKLLVQQRYFQGNSKAIEANSNNLQTIINIA